MSKTEDKEVLKENQWLKIKEKIGEIGKKQEIVERKSLKHNIFKILRMEDFEIRHSNFLAWLLNKDNNEKIKYKFAKGLLEIIKKHCKDKKEWNKNLEALNELISKLSCEEYIVKREDKYKDIMIEFNTTKVALVIENKLYSKEHSNQLQRYYDEVEGDKKYQNYCKIFVFLTLSGEKPVDVIDKRIWINISYSDILGILKTLLQNDLKNTKDETSLLLGSYIEILKEKTEKTMDRVSEYFKLYKENKEVLSEMLEYLPNIKQRAEIEKEYLATNKTLTLQTKNANTFLDVLIDELTDVFRAKNLPDDFVYMQLCNDPYSKFNIVFCMQKIDNLYKKFMEDFNEKFAIREKIERNGSYRTIYSTTIVSNTKQDGYITEAQFQEKITKGLKNFFEDKNSEYFKIVDFIKHYQFN